MKKLHSIISRTIVLTLALGLALFALAEERTAIVSANNGIWGNPTTWNPAQVPGIGDDVVITHEVTVSTSQSANSISVNSGGMLKVENSTLDVGDDVNDALMVNGGTLYFGDGATINVAGYYKQSYVDASNEGTMTSATGDGTAYFNISTAGERNSDTDNNYKISDNCVMALDQTNKSFILETTIMNGNAGSAFEVDFGVLSTTTDNYIARTHFTVKNGSGLANLYMDMNSTTVGKFFCDVASGNILHLSQTIPARDAKLVIVQISLESGTLQLQPGTAINVNQKVKQTAGAGLILDSDATEQSAVLIYTGDDPDATVRRYIQGNGWHYISPSTTDVVAGDFDQGGSPSVWLQRFVESDIVDHWRYITSPNVALQVAKGYSVYSEEMPRSDDFVIEYNGTLNSDLITVDLQYSGASDSDPEYGFNLVGNPFSAPLNFKKGGPSLGNNINQTLWVWDPDHNNGDGTYGRYSFFSWQGGGNFNGVFSVGQGFLVQAISDDNPSINMDPDYRVIGFNNWMKSSNGNWDDNHGLGTYLMLKVTNGVSKDDVFISFGENGTSGYENGYDAPKVIGSFSAPQLYLKEGGQKLSVNYIESLTDDEERVVALSFDAAMSGEYSLLANLDSLPDTKVSVEDIKTGITHDFKNGDYTFTCDKDENPDRFLVHFAYSPTGIEDGIDEVKPVNIYSYNKSVYINNTSNELNLNNSKVLIYDMLGREIYSNKMDLNNLTSIPVHINNSYIVVKVINDGFVTTEKVFIK